MTFSPHIVRQGTAHRLPSQIASASGAITITAGTVFITAGSAATLTLADPSVADNGAILWIICHTAAAHVVTNAGGAGFNDADTSGDVATFGAAIGNNLVLIAYDGIWHIVNNVGATVA